MKLLKRSLIFCFLFISVIGYSQTERFVEVVVTDSVTLKALGYTYVITSGMSNTDALVEYLGDGEEIIEPDKSMFELATLLKKEKFDFTLENDYASAYTFLKSDSAIVVVIKNDTELDRIKEFIDDELNFKGSVNDVSYETISLYDEIVYKNLYKKAIKKAKLIAGYSDGDIGKLMSASDNLSEGGDIMDWYQQLMELGALGNFKQTKTDGKLEIVKMVFRFELK